MASVGVLIARQWVVALHEGTNPYNFFRVMHQQANLKIHSLTQCNLTMNGCDWHILAGNNERIVFHCLTRFSKPRTFNLKRFLGNIAMSTGFKNYILNFQYAGAYNPALALNPLGNYYGNYLNYPAYNPYLGNALYNPLYRGVNNYLGLGLPAVYRK